MQVLSKSVKAFSIIMGYRNMFHSLTVYFMKNSNLLDLPFAKVSGCSKLLVLEDSTIILYLPFMHRSQFHKILPLLSSKVKNTI